MREKIKFSADLGALVAAIYVIACFMLKVIAPQVDFLLYDGYVLGIAILLNATYNITYFYEKHGEKVDRLG